jgi:hypothetical protein
MWHFAEGMNPPDDLFFTQSNGLMQLGQAWNDVETADSLNYFMGLAVNGDPSVMELVREFKDILPTELIFLLSWDMVEMSSY